METIAADLLVALASGTAGAAGQHAWTSLRDLVRRRTAPEAAPDAPDAPEDVPSGEEEFAALEERAESEERARALARALALRAAHDDAFRADLAAWRSTAGEAVAGTGAGDVHNEITGGTQGTVVMGRDFHGPITFNQP
ncbi:hypothetical protein [Streptomyces megasporus]|uniref:hypothetical protein n=1 Tax=Streptomyces megasporus TaxID=44060 RepID=UPI0004E0B222|nr:hypothetical protein [Streptomyces megasporus]